MLIYECKQSSSHFVISINFLNYVVPVSFRFSVYTYFIVSEGLILNGGKDFLPASSRANSPHPLSSSFATLRHPFSPPSPVDHAVEFDCARTLFDLLFVWLLVPGNRRWNLGRAIGIASSRGNIDCRSTVKEEANTFCKINYLGNLLADSLPEVWPLYSVTSVL